MNRETAYRSWHHGLVGAGMVSLALATSAWGQVAPNYLGRTFGVGARATALGDAYVSEAYDVSTIYSNPAAIMFLERNYLFTNHYQESQLHTMDDKIAFAFRTGRADAIAIGATVNHLGFLEASVRPSLKFIQVDLDAAYARALTSTLSVGGRISVQRSDIGKSQYWTSYSSVGLFYYPSPDISYGVVYSGIGTTTAYEFDGTSSKVGTERMQRTLQMGISMHFPASFKQKILTLTLTNEKIIGETGLLYKGGLEVYPVRFLALRIGDIVDPSTSSLRLGMGIVTDHFELDFAMTPDQSMVQFYEVSLMFGL